MRIKVRVTGIHGPEVAVDKLPWALPDSKAWKGGGFLGVPPLGSVVWVKFEGEGDHAYPVWSGGIWPEHFVTDREKPVRSSWFGSDKPHDKGSPLRPDPVKGDPSLAPNVFGYISPLQKTIELDDRKKREKILLSDQLGNCLFFNTEAGGFTMEAISGHQSEQEKPRGLTVLSDATNEKEAWQFYSAAGWLVGQDDLAKSFRVSSPAGFHVSVDEERDKVEIVTPNGVRLTINNEAKSIRCDTPAGRLMEIRDGSGGDGRIIMKGATEGTYLQITETGGEANVEMRSAGNMSIKAVGTLTFASGGDTVFLAESVLSFQPEGVPVDVSNTDAGTDELSTLSDHEQLPKAWEYSCFSDPVKAGGAATPNA
jgi:hypothetical protein